MAADLCHLLPTQPDPSRPDRALCGADVAGKDVHSIYDCGRRNHRRCGECLAVELRLDLDSTDRPPGA